MVKGEIYMIEYKSDINKLKLYNSIMSIIQKEIGNGRLYEEIELDLDEQIANLSRNGIVSLPLLSHSSVNEIIKFMNIRHYWVRSTAIVNNEIWLTYYYD